MKIKYLLIIALIVLSTSITKADDYYDIPPGWEKVIEYVSSQEAKMFAERNNILIGPYFTSDNGKTFEVRNDSILRRWSWQFYFNERLYLGPTFNPITKQLALIRYNLSNSSADTVYFAGDLDGIIDKIYVNYLDSTIIIKYRYNGTFGERDFCFISRDAGSNWESLKLYRVSSYNRYEIRFDERTPKRWIYQVSNGEDGPELEKVFITEDNGIKFDLIPNSNLIGIPRYNYDNLSDQDFSSDYTNSLTRFITKSKDSLEIHNLYSNNISKVISIKNLIKSAYNYNTTDSNYINTREKYLNKNLEKVLFTFDNLTNNKDTTNKRLLIYNSEYNTFKSALVRKTFDYPPTPNEFSTKLLYFDKTSDIVYLEICTPFHSKQRRIIIKRNLNELTNVEYTKDDLEAIILTDNKFIINKEYFKPEIKIYDLLGKKIEYKIISLSPLSLELNQSITNGIYILNIEDNSQYKFYKLIINK